MTLAGCFPAGEVHVVSPKSAEYKSLSSLWFRENKTSDGRADPCGFVIRLLAESLKRGFDRRPWQWLSARSAWKAAMRR